MFALAANKLRTDGEMASKDYMALLAEGGGGPTAIYKHGTPGGVQQQKYQTAADCESSGLSTQDSAITQNSGLTQDS